MRITFLTHNFPRHPGDVSGAFLGTLAAALAARGHELLVLAPSDAGRGGVEAVGGVEVRRVRYAAPRRETLAYRGTMTRAVRSPAGLLTLRRLHRALAGAAREAAGRTDVLHAHWWIPAGLAAPAGRNAPPLVLTSHGTDAALLHRSRAARWLARPVYRRADVVSTVSRQLADWIEAGTGRLVPDHHVHPMPVETGGMIWSGGGGGAVVVARLSAQKRIDLALRAVARLAGRGVALPLTVIGDGPERAALERLAAALGVADAVRFAGALPPAGIPAALARADLMLFPAAGEGFGLAAAEALMCGVPVVACRDGGGVLDIVPAAGAGRRADPEPDALAAAALELLRDPDARPAARRAGESWRRRLSPDHVAEVCEGWYREAMARRAPARHAPARHA